MTIHLLKSDDYHSQRNNRRKPHRECGNTSVANMLSSSGYHWVYSPESMGLDDFVYQALRGKICQQYASDSFGDWASSVPEQVPEMHRFVASMLTGKSHNLTWEANREYLTELIDNGIASVIATDFYVKDGVRKPNGHFVLASGLWSDQSGEGIIVDDPYGNAKTGYTQHNGYGVRYTWEEFLPLYHGIAVHRSI